MILINLKISQDIFFVWFICLMTHQLIMKHLILNKNHNYISNVPLYFYLYTHLFAHSYISSIPNLSL